jgi:hypothetical protein
MEAATEGPFHDHELSFGEIRFVIRVAGIPEIAKSFVVSKDIHFELLGIRMASASLSKNVRTETH